MDAAKQSSAIFEFFGLDVPAASQNFSDLKHSRAHRFVVLALSDLIEDSDVDRAWLSEFIFQFKRFGPMRAQIVLDTARNNKKQQQKSES